MSTASRSSAPSHLLVCPERLAASAAERIFARGGNAADAAIAAAFAQGVVDPFMCSLGGSSTAMIWDAGRRELYTLNCAASIGSVPPPGLWRENVEGRLETVGRIRLTTNENQVGYKSIMVPGFVRGAQELYERLASKTITWGDLLAPAIGLAEEGFEISSKLAECWVPRDDPGYPGARAGGPDFADKMVATPDASATFLKDGGGPYRAGERLVQKELARTLRTLAAEGPEAFYNGSIGAMIARDFRRGDAMIGEADLREYRAKIRQLISTTYRGYRVFTKPAAGARGADHGDVQHPGRVGPAGLWSGDAALRRSAVGRDALRLPRLQRLRR